MSIELYGELAFWLSLAGTLFSGYIAAHQLIKKECPFNEPCPYFLGRPACEYGFAMFFAMLIAAALTQGNYIGAADAKSFIQAISLLGILFAGYFVLMEVWSALRAGMQRYGLVFPTCAYGLVFYGILFVLSSLA